MPLLSLSLSLSLSGARSAVGASAPRVARVTRLSAVALQPRQRRVSPATPAPGFTIVELLIVIVVIAILAAITIVSYNGISQQAKTSAVQSLTSQAAKKLLSWSVQNNETFPANKTAFLAATNLTDPDGQTYQYTANTLSAPFSYCLTVTQNSVSYFINNTINSTPTSGSCPNVTNMATDPAARTSSNEWLARYSMYPLLVTGVSDGPNPGLNTYIRETQITTATGSYRGFDHLDNVDLSTPSYDASRLEWPVTLGSPITVSLYTRASVVNNAVNVAPRIHNGAGSWLAGAACPSTNYPTPNIWIRISCTITPSVSGYLDFGSRYSQSVTWPAGATIDATGLLVTYGSTLYSYSDPVTNSSWAWSGTANASTSTGPAS